MLRQRSVQRTTLAGQRFLENRLLDTRHLSHELVSPLSAEDMVVQAMEDASPTKWHLAHVTWFFETFILSKHLPGYSPFDDSFNYCFNSYYESQGPRQPRPKRGVLTRPSSKRVLAYRAHVDEALVKLFAQGVDEGSEVARLIEIGINHEQQHQELLLTDILALFSANPLRPAYRSRRPRAAGPERGAPGWTEYPGGIRQAGHDGNGYAWDNEAPRHDVLIHPFRLADRLVTNGEWLEFMADGGYRTAAPWLADGWATVNRECWEAPLYWEQRDGQWLAMSLEGLQPVEVSAPVCHVSYFEADAFARWAGRRLPTEFEWEIAAQSLPVEGNTLATRALRPLPAGPATGQPRQMFGDVWEWTQSAYLPYPGYRPPEGALGEYNGKFMVSQQVLRGASCATPDGHSRATYRNFFYPHQRWQFMGLRLAAEIFVMLNPKVHRLPVTLPAEGDDFAAEVMGGLSRPQKSLPCRFFYDARGSELFEEITRLPEYYPTRTEAAILKANAAEMAGAVEEGGVLVEFGSGSSLKTEILLGELPRLRAYVCIDVSSDALRDAQRRLARRFPKLDVRPIVGDFSYPIPLPPDLSECRKTGFFPGSTIGNLTPSEAERLLRVFRAVLSPGGRLIVGADLKKDARRLVLAYNDAAGVTAAFNLNLLSRINRELGGTFAVDQFRHDAVYNPREGRIEMHLESLKAQEVTVRGHRFRFKAGERIHTENSYKYSIDQFQQLARSAGWLPQRVWTDDERLFSVHELSSA